MTAPHACEGSCLCEPCSACGAGVGVECDADCVGDSGCIRDDSTECDCPRCEADELRWEEWQGWHLADPAGQEESE